MEHSNAVFYVGGSQNSLNLGRVLYLASWEPLGYTTYEQTELSHLLTG